jgi:serine/threonine protein kinase
MIEVDPKKRISAKDALKHPWFKEEAIVINTLLKINDNILHNN